MTILLAVDAATPFLHVALLVGDSLCTRRYPGGAAASQRLLLAMSELLAEAGLNSRQVDAFAFGRGPGAFTGLRTACAAAQGMAMATDRPVIAVDTLLAVAESARRSEDARDVRLYWSAVDARMGEIYAASYRIDGVWHKGEPPALYTPHALALRIHDDGGGVVAGNAAAEYGSVLAPVALSMHPNAEPDAEALAHLARAAYDRGELLDAAKAAPLYVRDKVASTASERVTSSVSGAARHA